MDPQILSRWVGLVGSLLWIAFCLAEILIWISPYRERIRHNLFRELMIAGLVGVTLWRLGLVLSSYAVPILDRGELALYIRVIDLATISVLIIRRILVLHKSFRLV